MQKISTVEARAKRIFKKQLTFGLDLGDRCNSYCVLEEAGEIVLEQKPPTTPEAMEQTFGRMPRHGAGKVRYQFGWLELGKRKRMPPHPLFQNLSHCRTKTGARGFERFSFFWFLRDDVDIHGGRLA